MAAVRHEPGDALPESRRTLPLGSAVRRAGIDAVVVPGLLLLIARELALHDPARTLAWRFLHEPSLQALPGWVAALLPRPNPDLDRDPVSMVLASAAVLGAVAYLAAVLARAGTRVRAAILALAALVLVVLPTAAFVALGVLMDRPYGQDGGVVQMPLALQKILSGQSPYGADYSDSILGKQARVSDFWSERGGNPILRHHAYLPGTHLLLLPFYLALPPLVGWFDPRVATLLALGAAAGFGALLVRQQGGSGEAALAAAAVVLINPLLHWPLIFGANDILLVALALAATRLAVTGRAVPAAAVLGLACATKQLAWPFAPFLIVYLSGARSWRDLVAGETRARLLRASAVVALVLGVVVLPVAARDFHAFWADIMVYNLGLPGADNYPLGGTPGFGLANFVIYFGGVASLREYVPFGRFYVLLVPLSLVLLRQQMREGRASTALVTGSVVLLASLYLSRVVHSNYLVLAAVLVPVAFLMRERRAIDVAVVPLLLLALAVEIAEHQPFRTVWEDALAVRLPQHLHGGAAALAPRAGPHLTADPFGLVFSATAAGLGVVYFAAGVLGASVRWRRLLAALAFALVVVVPTVVVVRIGGANGLPRAQDGWMSPLSVLMREAAGRSSPAAPVQSWTTSFRRDPPRPLPDEPAMPLERPLAAASGRTGLLDPRWIGLAGAVVVAMLAARLVGVSAPADLRLLVSAGLLLAPLAAVGLAFGSGDALLLALALAAHLAGRRWPAAAGLALGLTAGLFPRVLFVAPLIVPREQTRRALGGTALGVALVLLAGGGAAVANALGVSAGPVAGDAALTLASLRLYLGSTERLWIEPCLAIAVLATAVALGLRLRSGSARLLAASMVLLAGIAAGAVASAHDLLTPLGLLLLAAAVDGPGFTSETPPPESVGPAADEPRS